MEGGRFIGGRLVEVGLSIHEVLYSEWNTYLRNLIILHSKEQRNIP